MSINRGQIQKSDKLLLCLSQNWKSFSSTHQNEVRLIRWQHENGDIVVGEWCDDRFGDLGDSDGLWIGCVAAPWHHVQGQPCGVCNTDVLWLRKLWEKETFNIKLTAGRHRDLSNMQMSVRHKQYGIIKKLWAMSHVVPFFLCSCSSTLIEMLSF